MRNILHVLKRDFLRLLKVPPAMVVIIALMVLPSLYTWYNVLGFWNPYENTGNLKVCVVNEDSGADNELTGHIDVGSMIVDELQENEQLDWQFPSYEDAMDMLNAGSSYAVFVIPDDFSKDLLTILSGNFQQPQIEYYVNEKAGPVSPKITDTGANTLDSTVNAAFVETVSEKAAEAIDSAIVDSKDKIGQAKSQASLALNEARSKVQAVRDSVVGLSDKASVAQGKISSSKASLDSASADVEEAADAMDAIASLSSTLQTDYLQFSSEAVPAVNNAMKSIADAYSEIARLLGQLPAGSDEAREALERLQESANQAQADAERYSDILANDVSPAISQGLGEVASATAAASGSIYAQKTLVAQAKAILDDMSESLTEATSALDETSSLLEDLISEMEIIETDMSLLSSSQALTGFLGEEGIDAKKVAQFIGAPTLLKTESLFTPNSYGAAMAPLFMNLTFWIGAFMLMVVLRQEVDDKNIKNLTLTQRYVGRYLLFAGIVILQALICCSGLPVIGVEVANMPALIFAAMVSSLSYLSIIYALSVCLQHIGKGICVILVFAQIPGATGLYPIEMTSSFFQAIYPLFPFTYGIGAMRESICGFYGSHYASDVGILLGYLAAFMAIGILVRPWLANVNRMVAKQIKQSGIFNGENVEVPARRYRMSQVLRALTERKAYKRVVLDRYEKFNRAYPWIIKICIMVGLGVPLIVSVVFSLSTTEKVWVLTFWLLWIVLFFIFLVVVESLKESFNRQLKLDGMSDEELRDLFLHRNSTEKFGAAAERDIDDFQLDISAKAGIAHADGGPHE